MKTTLITGGAGFIGSHLCEKLLGDGHKVICVDDICTGSRENIAHLLANVNFTYIEHDITRPLKVGGNIDHLFHLASPASPVDYQRLPIETLLTGSSGTHNALELAKEKGATFLLTSSSEVYGDPMVHPQREDYLGNVNPVGPRSCYDEAKRFAEALTMAYYRKHAMDVRIVRIFNTYGPRMRKDDGRAIPNFIAQALANEPITIYGDGSQTRSFCYISDMVDSICKTIFSDKAKGEIINLGNPDEITILELAKRVKKLTESSSQIIFKELPIDDPRRRCPEISKARKILNWAPKVNLDAGLSKTIEWYARGSDTKMSGL